MKITHMFVALLLSIFVQKIMADIKKTSIIRKKILDFYVGTICKLWL
jgi:hypothetical protein